MPNVPDFIRVFFLNAVLVLAVGLSFTVAFPAMAQAPQAAPPPAGNGQSAPDTSPTRSPATSPASPAAGQPPATSPAADAAPASDAASQPGADLIPHDLSPYGMFMHADIIVKIVMVGLALASLITWTVLIAKAIELFGARAKASRALSDIAAAPTLREASATLRDARAPVTRLVDAAIAEADRSRGLPDEGVKDRAAALLSRIEARAGRNMGRGTGLLATIGSTAPFVGLFGTVWGIMDAFIGISQTHTTNLAVVAPGIAEALLATACGLVAAIPAVIIYNAFARAITGYRSLLGDASAEVMRLLSRDLDRDGASGTAVPVGRAAE